MCGDRSKYTMAIKFLSLSLHETGITLHKNMTEIRSESNGISLLL